MSGALKARMNEDPIGRRRWAIAEGYILLGSNGPAPELLVGAQRTLHVRYNDLRIPERVPLATDYASVIESDVPIVVQHSRLDSRQAANALLSTIAYAAD
jgi:hypothetical protein